jgi:hypothetical protein
MVGPPSTRSLPGLEVAEAVARERAPGLGEERLQRGEAREGQRHGGGFLQPVRLLDGDAGGHQVVAAHKLTRLKAKATWNRDITCAG